MKYLQILNLTLAALGATFSLVLGVVWLQFWIYRDRSASLQAQMPFLSAVTGAFAVLCLAGALAWAAHRRGWGARWLVQVFPGLSLAGIVAMLLSLR